MLIFRKYISLPHISVIKHVFSIVVQSPSLLNLKKIEHQDYVKYVKDRMINLIRTESIHHK